MFRHTPEIAGAVGSRRWTGRWVVLVTWLIVAAATPAPASAQVAQAGSNPPLVTSQRTLAIGAMLLALSGVVIGGVGLARSNGHAGRGRGRGPAVAASVLAPAGMVAGGLIVATAGGGVGTGNGLAGGVVAMMVGAIGLVVGGLALRRSRRTG